MFNVSVHVININKNWGCVLGSRIGERDYVRVRAWLTMCYRI